MRAAGEWWMNGLERILIVGGGIAGMASAIRLREAGVAVDLIDLDPQWRVYGAGITITGPTLRAYKRLGLIEAIKAEGAISNATRIYRYDGLLLRELDEPSLEEGLPATGGIMRPVLHRIMQERVNALGTTVRLGLTVVALVDEDDGVSVTFSDGSIARYDLVLGADGIFSRVRALAFPGPRLTRPTGQGCWRITSPRPPGFDKGEFYFGHRNPAGITACAPNEVYMFVLTEDREQKRIPDDELHDRLRAHIADFGGNIGWMRDRMTAQTWINYRPLEAGIVPAPWNRGRVVLVGDSAHATTPHLASGAGMAVESALVLTEELLRPGVAIEQALAAYVERRFERCRMIVETSVAIGRQQLAGGSPEVIGGMIGGALHALAGEY
jgi:2-polyprenyl-6-methoxyphenol hydroxylase-like FAD-dependent oxidoreductase